MARRFIYERLPEKVKERISSIEFADDLIDDLIGLVYLKDEYEFDDGSHCEGFASRQDLIDIVMEAERV